jgi:hypothetical protein
MNRTGTSIRGKTFRRVAPIVFVAVAGMSLAACGSGAAMGGTGGSGGTGGHGGTTTTTGSGGIAY